MDRHPGEGGCAGHDHAEAELAVEIGAADANAVIGENIGSAIGLAVAVGPQAHDRKVGGTAADIGNEHQLFAPDLGFVIKSSSNGLELESDVLEADRMTANASLPDNVRQIAILVTARDIAVMAGRCTSSTMRQTPIARRRTP